MIANLRRAAAVAAAVASTAGAFATLAAAPADAAEVFRTGARPAYAFLNADETKDAAGSWTGADSLCREQVAGKVNYAGVDDLNPFMCADTVHYCAEVAKDGGMLAGITFYTDQSGYNAASCWTYPDTSLGREQVLVPRSLPATGETDPWFLVSDLDAPFSPPHLTTIIGLEQRGRQASEPYTALVRMSAGFFGQRTSLDGFAWERPTEAITYYDWSGTQRWVRVQVTKDGNNLFVSTAVKSALSLKTDVCAKASITIDGERSARLCTVSNSIQYLGADGHRYSAGIAKPDSPRP
jgi:hypothetical protein